MGRPKKNTEKRIVIPVDFSAEEKEKLRQEAIREGRSLAGWVRHLISTHPARKNAALTWAFMLVWLTGCAIPKEFESPYPYEKIKLDSGLNAMIWLPQGGIQPNQKWVLFAPTWISGAAGNKGGTPEVFPAERGHEELIRRLTNEGIALVGVDVGITFGNQFGRDGFTEFYQYLTTKRDFNPKGCMYVQSQGGMMGYTWILDNPGIIECVGGVFPITSVEDYAGIPYFASMWGLSEQFLIDNKATLNPLDRAAEFDFPIMHLHGTRDDVARFSLAREFFQRVNAAGGQGTLVEILGVGHEYKKAELFDNPILFDFLINNVPR